MNTIKEIPYFRSISKILADNSLTKKASLNALASILDYAARLVVGFVITPFMVSVLGDFYYGAWQFLMRLIGYLNPASGRPTQALKMTLANQQTVADDELKRRHMGSTIIVWAMFLPIMLGLGGLLTWFAPIWINAPLEYFLPIRLSAAILVINLVVYNLTILPQSVLEGENLGYKRMGASALLVLLGGGLTWLALYLKTGIAGVAVSNLTLTLITGIFWLRVMRTNVPWVGVARPSYEETRKFLGLSLWFLGWNLLMTLMTASDVVVLGLLKSAEMVTSYTLTKYAPETLISIIAIMAFGIAPGLGGIIGSGMLEKATRVRGEIWAFTWLIVTVIGTTILIWNRAFIGLWVGADHYVGTIPNLLIIIVVMQFVLIRNDSNVIDLTLRLNRKVTIGAISVAISLTLACILVGYFDWGVVGLSLGIFIGRLILSVGYPVMVGRSLGISLVSQLKSAIRPSLVTILLFGLATMADESSSISHWVNAQGWIGFLFFAGITFVVILLLAYYLGLPSKPRKRILRRIRGVITKEQE